VDPLPETSATPETHRSFVANARMYAVTEVAARGWRRIFEWVAERAGVDLTPIEHSPPAPLTELWGRPDLGCAFMCGWPFARAAPQPRLLAAPVPAPERYGDQPIYFTDIVVRRDSRFTSIEDTFGGTVGWTLEDSHSGFNALRHHLLPFRTPERPTLYARSVGSLVNPLGALKAVVEGRVDAAPVDSYCHDLFKAHGHPCAALTRTIATTAPAPIPVLIASPGVPEDIAERVRAALLEAHRDPDLAPALADVLLRRFERPDPARYAYGEAIAQAATEAGYRMPS
jgi:ABC-type phosphate/phosphonate transport system substrate-binding protein